MPADETTAVTVLAPLLKACAKLAMNPREPATLRKLLALNLRWGAEHKPFYAAVLEGHAADALFLDWDHAPAAHALLKDPAFWIGLVSRYGRVLPHEQAPGDEGHMIATLATALSKVGIAVDWGTAVRTLLLANIARTQGAHTVQLFLERELNADLRTSCLWPMAELADAHPTPEQYTAGMRWAVMLATEPDTAALAADLDRQQHSSEAMREAVLLRTIQASHGRPRLRDRLQRLQHRATAAPHDMFAGFQASANFSSNISSDTQLRAYVVMAQTAVDCAAVLEQVLPPGVAQAVAQRVVSDPDADVLKRAIERMQYTRAPFAELTEFHRTCFNSISFSQQGKLNLSQVMQLYVAAYQAPSVWEECWTHVLPVMSSQLKNDLNAFRAKHPRMDADAFVYALHNML